MQGRRGRRGWTNAYGQGACPPEDCGGAWGYANLKDILKESTHAEYEERKEWLGLSKNQAWDAGQFSLERAHNVLQKI